MPELTLRALVSKPRAPTAAPPTTNAETAPVLRYPGSGKIFLFWTALGLLTSLRYGLQRPTDTAVVGDVAFVAAFTSLYYPWIALTSFVFRLEQRFPLGHGNWFRNLGLLALFSVPLCLLAAPLMSGAFYGVLSLFHSPPPARSVVRLWLGHFPMAEVLFWCSVAWGYFVRTQFQLREQDQRAARLAIEKSQLEAGLKQAQLDVIRARLNPHFLFNSLQNISVLTRQDAQTASRMLARLGDLLRAVLRQDSDPESTLYDEIELTRAYVALEQMRFGDRLEVSFQIAPETQRAMVPCFLLQPLIENAVIHGLRGAGKAGVITVAASAEKSDLVLTVTDNGIGPDEDALSGRKVGIGLGSTRERLAAMYQDRHAFTMRRLAEDRTEVRILIPLRFSNGEEDSMERPSH